MCILFLYNGAQDSNSGYSLILASNRDEYYDRPTQNMQPWSEDPSIIGGRDLEANDRGTWLAISPLRKKIGVILNLPGITKKTVTGRGKIVADFVKSNEPVEEYIEEIKKYCNNCNEFIFVSAEIGNRGPTIFSYSNANNELMSHTDTYIGFGNSLPESPLKKIEAGKHKLQEICSTYNKVSQQQELVEKLLEFLKSDERYLPDHQLETRRPKAYKELSSLFVSIPQARYGTRTHTIVLVTKSGHLEIIEDTLQAPIDILNPKWNRTEFQFDIENDFEIKAK